MNPLYTVSIAAYNNLELTRKCIRSVMQYSPEDVQIIVTDNGSTDATPEFLKLLGKTVGVIRNEQNLGFVAAHNRATEFALGSYFVVLNNDCEVSEGWLDAMRAEFNSHSKLGACGIRDGACSALDREGYGVQADRLEYVEASCAMFPLWLIREVGLFDRAFRFAYCEDADVSLRLRERGYGIATVDIPLRHLRASTSSMVRRQGVDIDGYHAFNHAVLRNRWATYLERRSFAKRILLRRRGAAGDVLMLTPLIHAMKQKWAESEIDVVTDLPGVLEGNSEVSHVYSTGAELPKGYDEQFNLDLAYESRPQMHIAQAYGEACGVEVKDYRPRVCPQREHRDWAAHALIGDWAVIHPGRTAWVGRDWSVVKFEQLAGILRSRGYHVAVVGDASSPYITSELDLRGKTNFSQLAAVIERAKLFVGIDSLLMHLAQASHIPTVGVFGCIDPKYRLIDAPFVVGVQAENVGCLGCHHVLPAPRTVNNSCLRSKVYCMENLTVAQVVKGIDRALKGYAMQLETSKIRHKVLQYCKGRGIDFGCSRDKIRPEAVGMDDDSWPEVDVVGDIAHPEFPSAEFDYVYSSHALEDQLDTEAVLKEWNRVLKQGGVMILYLPHKDYYKGVNLDHKHEFVPGDITSILEHLGHSIEVNENDVGEDRYSFLIVSRKPEAVCQN